MAKKKDRTARAQFPVSPENPFGIDLSPEMVEEFVVRETAPKTKPHKETKLPIIPAWSDPTHGIWLFRADCLSMLDRNRCCRQTSGILKDQSSVALRQPSHQTDLGSIAILQRQMRPSGLLAIP